MLRYQYNKNDLFTLFHKDDQFYLVRNNDLKQYMYVSSLTLPPSVRVYIIYGWSLPSPTTPHHSPHKTHGRTPIIRRTNLLLLFTMFRISLQPMAQQNSKTHESSPELHRALHSFRKLPRTAPELQNHENHWKIGKTYGFPMFFTEMSKNLCVFHFFPIFSNDFPIFIKVFPIFPIIEWF